MDLTKIDVQDMVYRLQEEVAEVMRIIQDKGPKHFQNAFMIGGGTLFAAFFILYRPTVSKLADLRNEIAAEEAKAAFAEDYETVRSRLYGMYSKLPKPDRKDGWLFDRILQTAQSQGIVLDSIGSQGETSSDAYYLLSIPVQAKLTYAQIGKFVEALENQVPGLYVTSLEVARIDDRAFGLGVNDVSMQISTVMPKKLLPL